jgi:hypothetical protein
VERVAEADLDPSLMVPGSSSLARGTATT